MHGARMVARCSFTALCMPCLDQHTLATRGVLCSMDGATLADMGLRDCSPLLVVRARYAKNVAGQ